MHNSEAVRLGEIPDADKQPQLANLPEESHIVSGTIEGHGAVSLASERAKLSGKIIKLERTSSGGIDYQVAIFVSEPVAAPELVSAPQASPEEVAAVSYFTDKGMSEKDAQSQVKRFGTARVLALREKELDEELAKVAKVE